eukprot:jgi/Mesvir1/1013/Mv17547-RA.1
MTPAHAMFGRPTDHAMGDSAAADREWVGMLAKIPMVKRFTSKRRRLPDVLWSAFHGVDFLLNPQLLKRCAQKGFPFKANTRRYVLAEALLDIPGEIELFWEAFGLSLEQLKSICGRKYPSLLPERPEDATREELIRRLANSERKEKRDYADLKSLVKRENGKCLEELIA